jgi:hypothetical protein
VSGQPLNDAKIELVQGEIAAVSLNPGDRLVIMCQGHLSREQIERLGAEMKRWAPNVPCAVLEDGLRLGVIRAAEEPKG